MFYRVCVSGLYAALVSRPVGACGAVRGASGAPRLAVSRAPSGGPLRCASLQRPRLRASPASLHETVDEGTRSGRIIWSRAHFFSPPGFFTCSLKPRATVCQQHPRVPAFRSPRFTASLTLWIFWTFGSPRGDLCAAGASVCVCVVRIARACCPYASLALY